jgi:DNA repair protein RecN (Recombination protein N)
MLQNLQIKNYAIIDEIGISFSNGLNVITGETGAGKSILMGALSLILGERADTSVLLDKEKKCFIEGSFKTNHELVKKFLHDNDLEAEDDIVIRREIATNGKSRAFVNDSPVNLNILRELSSLLVDLHQQFDTLELGDNNFQREVIDALANQNNALRQYQQVFKQYTSAQKQLAALKLQQASANKEFDYQNFLFNELEDANFSIDELEQGEAALKTLNNAENIKSTLSTIYSVLQENEQPLIQQIKSLNNQLTSLKNFHPGIQVLTDRLHSTQVELQDIADELDHLNNSVSFSEEKINALNERLALGYRLLKKHGVQTTADLISIKNELQLKLNQITDLAEVIAKEETMVNEFLKQASEAAENISANRHKQIKPFEQKVNLLLAKVGMPNAKIKVQMEQTELNYYGSDSVEFLFDANNSGRFESLRRVASGGELSRLMLCIKSLVAKSVQLPTLIFDEIDTGISGEAARQVAIIMKELSVAHQLISITHQPQIAAKAEAHYFVYKEIKGDKIATAIKLLDRDEQITTIATMLSGERPTAAAFANAREMIGN